MNEQDRPKFAVVLLCLFLLVVVLAAIRVATAVQDPFFSGDPGHRMHLAYMPIVRVGNRIWLPALQVQIWFLYLLHLPYYAFKLIPCAYFSIALWFLGLLTYRLTRESYAGLLFTLLLVFCFSHQSALDALGVRLYQEPIELACFYFLLWAGAIGLRENRWLLPVGGAALLVRDSFWIYLFTISLLNWKDILSRKSYRLSFLLLWTIPVVWMLSIPLAYLYFEGRFPKFLVEWPLGINKQGSRAVAPLLTSWESLLFALVSSRAVTLVGGLIIVSAIGTVDRSAERKTTGLRDPFYYQFRRFSSISLVIIYTLILLFDPWEFTFANQRMAVPLLAHAFVWAGLLFADTRAYTSPAKVVARGILIAALLSSMDLDLRTWIPRDYSRENRIVAEISDLVEATRPGRTPHVCIVGETYWQALDRFVAATLYARRSILRDLTTAEACDLLIAPSDAGISPGPSWVELRDYELRGRSYAVFQRRRER